MLEHSSQGLINPTLTIFENLFEEGLHLVEWGDENLEKALKKNGESYTLVKISPSKNGRKYEVISA